MHPMRISPLQVAATHELSRNENTELVRFQLTSSYIQSFKNLHMALRVIAYGSPEYHRMVELRNAVLRKPLGLVFSEEELQRDMHDILIAAFDEDIMLACCILTSEGPNACKLRQMAVQKNRQGKGIGAAIIGFAENIARDRGYRKIIMHARSTAVGFYEKLGYSTFGDQFEEVTIPHFSMQKTLI